MKQLTFLGPGSLEWRDVPEPLIQTPQDAIIRPTSVATCDVDGAVIRGLVALPGPYAFGHECAAEVVEVGSEVTAVRPGDHVICAFQISCGTCERCQRGLTGSCSTVPPRSAFGLKPLSGDWGSALSDFMRVPFADAMMVKVQPGLEPLASLADNIPDGYRAVAPYLEERPNSSVLILGGAGPSSVGLYAVSVAVAMGGRVDYVDCDARRLEIAASLGAHPIERGLSKFPVRLGPYPIVVDHTSDHAGLACALRSTEPGGICTATAIYFEPETPLPMLDMYSTGITLRTGRVHARPNIDPSLKLYEAGNFFPERVTTETASWEDAIDALKSYTTKLVIMRS